MKTYLTKTKYDTYKYIRRVPKELLEHTDTSTFRVSLGSNQLEATQTALSFNNAVNEALQLVQLHVEEKMILAKLEGLLPKEKVEAKPESSQLQGCLKELSAEYLASQEDNISSCETRDKRYFYELVSPCIFHKIGVTDNPKLISISYSQLLEFRAILVQLPKRNIQKYRDMDLNKLLQSLNKVQSQEKLSARTINKYIKWLRALFNFAIRLSQLQVNLANSIPLLKTVDDKLQRLPLNQTELALLQDSMPQKMQYLLQVLACTGMRLSELYKCEIEEIEGIKCFSLLNRDIKLKTKSSYRVIPVHSSLLEQVGLFYELRKQVSSDNLAKTTSAAIKRLDFKNKEKKSLYSLRHSFATTLIQQGADTSIVSELLGHSHKTMTLSRYSTGFSVGQLREVVELLS